MHLVDVLRWIPVNVVLRVGESEVNDYISSLVKSHGLLNNWSPSRIHLLETEEIPFPKFTGGVGEALRKYLIKKRAIKNVWTEIVQKREKKGE